MHSPISGTIFEVSGGTSVGEVDVSGIDAMEDERTERVRATTGRRRLTMAATAMALSMGWPAVAMATPVDGPPSVAMYTATALGSVVVMAILMTLGLKIAHRLRLIGSERHVRLHRRLRVLFGATFLLAAVTPYVSLNFSVATLVPFVAGAGVIVASWVWAASPVRRFDAESSPPSEA